MYARRLGRAQPLPPVNQCGYGKVHLSMNSDFPQDVSRIRKAQLAIGENRLLRRLPYLEWIGWRRIGLGSAPPGHCGAARRSRRPASQPPLDHHGLDVRDRLGRVEALGAGLGAVHDRVAAIKAERVLEIVEPVAPRFVARIDEPAVGLEQDRRAKVAVAGPPVARAGGRAAGAEDALVEPVELGPLLRRLQPFLLRRRARRLEPWLDRGVLGEEHRLVRHEILDHLLVGQRVDRDRRRDLVDAAGAGERIEPVDVHRAGAAHPLAAGAAEGQRRIDLGFDPDQRVEDHRPAIIAVDEIDVDMRIGAVVRVPAIDAEFGQPRGARRLRPGLAGRDSGSFGGG